MLSWNQLEHENPCAVNSSFTVLQRNRVLASRPCCLSLPCQDTTALALLVEAPLLEQEEKERREEDRETTLGERRSLARRPDPSVLDRLLSDLANGDPNH